MTDKHVVFMMVGALLTAASCSKESHKGIRDEQSASSRTSTSSGLVGKLRQTTRLDVQSIAIKAGRVDVEILYDALIVDADSGLRLFQATADRIWSLDPRLSRADTVAVATLRNSDPPGAVERSTYFYYRANHSRQTDVGKKDETKVP